MALRALKVFEGYEQKLDMMLEVGKHGLDEAAYKSHTV